MEGLRERKKRQTREAIAAAAMQLFHARGFDSVTVAEVARAADVSEKTVFNHFPTKEDLVFAHTVDHVQARLEAIRSRPPGVPLIRVFEGETMAFLDALEDGPESLLAIPRLVRTSRALRDRLLLAYEQEVTALVAAVTDDEDDLEAAAVVRALVWTGRLVFRTALRRVAAGEDPADVAADLREQARRAYARLGQGLDRYQG